MAIVVHYDEIRRGDDVIPAAEYEVVAILETAKIFALPAHRSTELLLENHPASAWRKTWGATGFTIVRLRDLGINHPDNVTAYLVKLPDEQTRQRISVWQAKFPEFAPPAEASTMAELQAYYQQDSRPKNS